MASKTFKIGEYAVGGIISVEITGKVIQVKALDWNTKEVVQKGTIVSTDLNAESQLDTFLNDLTSYYYAEKVMNWIKEKVEFKPSW